MLLTNVALADVALYAAAMWAICTAGFGWIVWRETRQPMDEATTGERRDEFPADDGAATTVAP